MKPDYSNVFVDWSRWKPSPDEQTIQQVLKALELKPNAKELLLQQWEQDNERLHSDPFGLLALARKQYEQTSCEMLVEYEQC
jgi:hypothetical protein